LNCLPVFFLSITSTIVPCYLCDRFIFEMLYYIDTTKDTSPSEINDRAKSPERRITMTEIKICDRSHSLAVSKKFYEKAARYGSDEYAMLRQARLDFPNYKIVVVARKPSKTSKPVFKRLTYEFMAAYIIKHDDESQTTMKVFQRMTATSDEDEAQVLKAKTYQEVKRWFLEVFPEILQCHHDREELLTRKTA